MLKWGTTGETNWNSISTKEIAELGGMNGR